MQYSHYNKFLRKLIFNEQPLFNSLVWFLIAFLLYAVGGYPFQDYFRIAQNPFITDPEASFYQDAILLPLVSNAFGFHKHLLSFVFLCALFLFAAVYLMTALVRKRFGDKLAVFVPPIVILHPLSIILYNWLGSPDSLTLLLSGIVIFANSTVLVFLASLLGVMNHPQMLIIAPILGILELACYKSRPAFKKMLSILAGCVVGYMFVKIFLWYFQIDIPFNRINFMLSKDISYWLGLKISEFPASIISLYGGLWLVIIICVRYGYKYNPHYYHVFFAIQIFCLIVTIFVWDTTRVFGLLTIAGVVHCIMVSLEFVQQNSYTNYRKLQQIISILLIVIIFIPKSVAWYGQIIYPKSRSYFQILIETFLQ